jgi:hypothetical protein
MPRSIGAIIPWVAHSRMLGDFRNTYSWTTTSVSSAMITNAMASDGTDGTMVQVLEISVALPAHNTSSRGTSSTQRLGIDDTVADCVPVGMEHLLHNLAKHVSGAPG